MSDSRSLSIYLDDIPRRRAERGNFNLINLIRSAFEKRGFKVELAQNTPKTRMQSSTDPGYSLFHMDDPFHPRALTLRRAYYYPFWRIEKSAQRWKWQIAKALFQPDKISPPDAAQFCQYWRKRLFNVETLNPQSEPFAYVPLQGRLLNHRSFQTTSPLSMIETILKNDIKRQVRVSFHPKETYTDAERNAVSQLAKDEPRLVITSDPSEELLARCAYVATQNSSVALAGFFFHKPAVLFASIDFHHIAANVADSDAATALAAAPNLTPDYDRYLYWFLKQTAINGGSPDAETQIIDAVKRHGWIV